MLALIQHISDALLDTAQYTASLRVEGTEIRRMTDVPNVGNLTRVLFKDLKEMTDVKSVENLTMIGKAHLKDAVAIKWVKE